MSKRFLLTILTLVIIAAAAGLAVFFAKGYRLSPSTGSIAGTGILSVNSIPDQASIYIDGHLSAATNSNINSLPPKGYQVRVVKEGYIPWEKQVDVKEGLVTEIKATLYRTIPSIYPLTYTGAEKTMLSPDGNSLMFIIPNSEENNLPGSKKAGIWVWQMANQGALAFGGNEPHQVALSDGSVDFGKATSFRWSPDSLQILASFPDRHLLMDVSRLNEPGRDVTPTVQSTIKSWDDSEKSTVKTRLEAIKDVSLKENASSSAFVKWSPDDSKILYSKDGKKDFKVVDLVTQKNYELPQLVFNQFEDAKSLLFWLPDAEHIALVETVVKPTQAVKNTVQEQFQPAKVLVFEVDGSNRSEIYAGSFDPHSVFAWPDGSRIVLISSVPTATASGPNLFGINLK